MSRASDNPSLMGLFEPTDKEIDASDVAVVRGALPAEMDGVYLRNGPNPRFPPLGSYDFPFDGDGMIHGLWVRDGKARYRNRFVRTPMLEAELATGRALWGGMRSGLKPEQREVGEELAGREKDVPAINVVRHAGKLLALSEMSRSYRLTPLLDTIGAETFGEVFPTGICAHPKIDPGTGELLVFTYGIEPPYLCWASIGVDGRVAAGPYPIAGVDRPYMVHDFAITATRVVLFVHPLVIDPQALMRGSWPLRWQPELGSQAIVIHRDGTGAPWSARADAFWVWHYANAYDDGEDVVVDAVAWSTFTEVGAEGRPSFDRIHLSPSTDRMKRAPVLAERDIEFPGMDVRRTGRRHTRVAVAHKTDRASDAFDSILTIDPATGAISTFEAGNLVVGEPCYVPKPGSTDDTSGWFVTFASDRATRESFFLVLPAEDVSAGPVATVRIPARIPIGLHGTWLPGDGGA